VQLPLALTQSESNRKAGEIDHLLFIPTNKGDECGASGTQDTSPAFSASESHSGFPVCVVFSMIARSAMQ
jgi:hypothetical protein